MPSSDLRRTARRNDRSFGGGWSATSTLSVAIIMPYVADRILPKPVLWLADEIHHPTTGRNEGEIPGSELFLLVAGYLGFEIRGNCLHQKYIIFAYSHSRGLSLHTLARGICRSILSLESNSSESLERECSPRDLSEGF